MNLDTIEQSITKGQQNYNWPMSVKAFMIKYENCDSGHHTDAVIIEPHHEKTCFMIYANNKGADQPAHPCSLISTFMFTA